MRSESVLTLIEDAHRGGQHFTLASRQGRLPEHDIAVEGEGRSKNGGIETHGAQDGGHFTGATDGRIIKAL